MIVVFILAGISIFFPPAWFALGTYIFYLVMTKKRRRNRVIVTAIRRLLYSGNDNVTLNYLYYDVAKKFAFEHGATLSPYKDDPADDTLVFDLVIDRKKHSICFQRWLQDGTLVSIEATNTERTWKDGVPSENKFQYDLAEEHITRLIVEAAKTEGCELERPELRYSEILQFAKKHNDGADWFSEDRGVRFWTFIGDKGYVVCVRNLAHGLGGEGGVSMSAWGLVNTRPGVESAAKMERTEKFKSAMERFEAELELAKRKLQAQVDIE